MIGYTDFRVNGRLRGTGARVLSWASAVRAISEFRHTPAAAMRGGECLARRADTFSGSLGTIPDASNEAAL